MAIHVTEQLRTFLLSILLGLGAGVLYDLLRAVRLRHPRLTAPLASSGGSSCWEVWAAAFCFFPCSRGPCGRFGTSGWTGGWNCSNF